MASPTAILEPQIILNSVDGDDVILNASPEWKKKLVDFLKYAEATDDAEVDCIADVGRLGKARTAIKKQAQTSNVLKMSKLDFLGIMPAVIALSVMGHCDFYDYPADDFDRLHDDLLDINDDVFGANVRLPRRLKTGLSGDFDG